MRHVIGIPARKVRWDDPNHAPFVGMIDWILQVADPYVLTVSAYPFLLKTCPGGMEYLHRRGFGMDGGPCRVPIRDFSSRWVFRDPATLAAIRSLEHLYSAIESDLAQLARRGRPPEEIFLLTSGDPNVGNSLVDLWKVKHPAQTRIHATRSPVDMAGDWVEKQANRTGGSLQRDYLSGPEVMETSVAALQSLPGLVLLMSVENDYRRSSADPSLTSRVFEKLADCYGPRTPVYGFHAGYEGDERFVSTLDRILADLQKPEVQMHLPYTFVIDRSSPQEGGRMQS